MQMLPHIDAQRFTFTETFSTLLGAAMAQSVTHLQSCGPEATSLNPGCVRKSIRPETIHKSLM